MSSDAAGENAEDGTLTWTAPIATAAVTTRACPVQIEGQLTDGTWYYFRARGRRISIGLGRTFHLACEAEAFNNGPHAEIEYSGPDEPYAAGWITITEASMYLADLVEEALPEPGYAWPTRTELPPPHTQPTRALMTEQA